GRRCAPRALRGDMTFVEHVQARAAALGCSIAFPETADERTQQAIAELARRRLVRPVAILDPAAPESHDAVRKLGVDVRDPRDDPAPEAATGRLLARRREKLTKDEAQRLVHTPLLFADSLVADGQVDGCVAGAVHTTGDVLKAALWTVGAADGVRTVS